MPANWQDETGPAVLRKPKPINRWFIAFLLSFLTNLLGGSGTLPPLLNVMNQDCPATVLD